MDLEDFGGDYDAFENYLDTLPPGRRHPLAIDASPRQMKRIARKLAHLKKRALKKGETFKGAYTLQGTRMLEAVDGWYSGDGAYTEEDEAHLRKFFVSYFEPKGIIVDDVYAVWIATSVGYNGYEIYRVKVAVS
jgi:hypothetical protein